VVLFCRLLCALVLPNLLAMPRAWHRTHSSLFVYICFLDADPTCGQSAGYPWGSRLPSLVVSSSGLIPLAASHKLYGVGPQNPVGVSPLFCGSVGVHERLYRGNAVADQPLSAHRRRVPSCFYMWQLLAQSLRTQLPLERMPAAETSAFSLEEATSGCLGCTLTGRFEGSTDHHGKKVLSSSMSMTGDIEDAS